MKALVVRPAREIRAGGCRGTQRELIRLGHPAGSTTVREIPTSAGTDPAPRRGGPTRHDFLTAQDEGVTACDFAHTDLVDPEAEHGPLDLDALLGTPEPDTVVYCCGPEGLLAAVEQRCASWPEGSLHVERFAAKPSAAVPSARDREFEVVCERAGTSVRVPAGRSVLDCLDDAGVVVHSACRDGVCGSCETKVLAGRVDHRNSLLTASERESGHTMMLCVSRALSDQLVLDL